MTATNWIKGNFTLSAVAETVPDEVDAADNNCTGCWIIVSMIGDIIGPNGCPDGKVDARDVLRICSLFGVKYPEPKYDPNCDPTGPTQGFADGKIDARNVSLVSSRYGQKDP